MLQNNPLYDRLTPESYLESMRKVVALLPDKPEQKIWDAGCGTGLLLLFLENAVKQGMIYYGSNLLSAGLSQLRMQAKDLRVSDRVACFQNDITARLSTSTLIEAFFSSGHNFDEKNSLTPLFHHNEINILFSNNLIHFVAKIERNCF